MNTPKTQPPSPLAEAPGSAIAHDPELCAARLAACGDAAAEVVMAAQEAEKWKTECSRLLAENIQLRQSLEAFERNAWMERLAETCQADDKPCEGWYEWETQTTEPDGCWRTWSSGFASLESAMESLLADRAAGKRWNKYMPDDAVKWRVERRIVWTRYYEPNICRIEGGVIHANRPG